MQHNGLATAMVSFGWSPVPSRQACAVMFRFQRRSRCFRWHSFCARVRNAPQPDCFRVMLRMFTLIYLLLLPLISYDTLGYYVVPEGMYFLTYTRAGRGVEKHPCLCQLTACAFRFACNLDVCWPCHLAATSYKVVWGFALLADLVLLPVRYIGIQLASVSPPPPPEHTICYSAAHVVSDAGTANGRGSSGRSLRPRPN